MTNPAARGQARSARTGRAPAPRTRPCRPDAAAPCAGNRRRRPTPRPSRRSGLSRRQCGRRCGVSQPRERTTECRDRSAPRYPLTYDIRTAATIFGNDSNPIRLRRAGADSSRKTEERRAEDARRAWFRALEDVPSRARKEIDADLLDELESTLICADIGVRTTEEILDRIRERVDRHSWWAMPPNCRG